MAPPQKPSFSLGAGKRANAPSNAGANAGRNAGGNNKRKGGPIGPSKGSKQAKKEFKVKKALDELSLWFEDFQKKPHGADGPATKKQNKSKNVLLATSSLRGDRDKSRSFQVWSCWKSQYH